MTSSCWVSCSVLTLQDTCNQIGSPQPINTIMMQLQTKFANNRKVVVTSTNGAACKLYWKCQAMIQVSFAEAAWLMRAQTFDVHADPCLYCDAATALLFRLGLHSSLWLYNCNALQSRRPHINWWCVVGYRHIPICAPLQRKMRPSGRWVSSPICKQQSKLDPDARKNQIDKHHVHSGVCLFFADFSPVTCKHSA